MQQMRNSFPQLVSHLLLHGLKAGHKGHGCKVRQVESGYLLHNQDSWSALPQRGFVFYSLPRNPTALQAVIMWKSKQSLHLEFLVHSYKEMRISIWIFAMKKPAPFIKTT
jgi:hypothetical protein